MPPSEVSLSDCGPSLEVKSWDIPIQISVLVDCHCVGIFKVTTLLSSLCMRLACNYLSSHLVICPNIFLSSFVMFPEPFLLSAEMYMYHLVLGITELVVLCIVTNCGFL